MSDVDERPIPTSDWICFNSICICSRSFQVQSSERLVEQQHPGPIDDCPGKRYPLTLSTGKLGRTALVMGFQSHHVQGLAHPLLALGFADLGDLESVLDVAGHAHVRKQRVVLEDGVDGAVVGREAADVPAGQLDGARVRLLEARDHLQRRRLSRARGRGK